MENNKVMGFLYPIARQFGFGEPKERQLENSNPPVFQSIFTKGTINISVLSDEAGVLIDVAYIDSRAGKVVLTVDNGDPFDQAAAWLAGR